MKKKENKKQNIVIYKDSKGNVQLKADIKKETIWATQDQIAGIFGTQRPAITKHLNNIFKSRELEKNSVSSILEHTAIDGKKYKTQFYNLDAVIAVGYRINSKQATQFRIWATKTLRDYIIKGVAINTERIKKLHEDGIKDLRSKIEFIQNTIKKRELDKTEVDSLLSVISDYANSWVLLRKFDDGDLSVRKGKSKEKNKIGYDFARSAIDELRSRLMKEGEAGDLFGNERDQSFKGVLETIYQTFYGKELYESLEEKAAHLLYFLIKDHTFSDGNKRIGSFLFILFLDRNKILNRPNGEKKISDNTLVALALLIAESDPNEKENMIALITNLLV
jgi:prophage maintenance system killer protein